jgi:hypothetical protein
LVQDDITYYRRRLFEERFQLGIARNIDTAAVHRKLALLYESRLASLLTNSVRDSCAESVRPAPAPDRANWSALLARSYSTQSDVVEPCLAPTSAPKQVAHMLAHR